LGFAEYYAAPPERNAVESKALPDLKAVADDALCSPTTAIYAGTGIASPVKVKACSFFSIRHTYFCCISFTNFP